MKARLPWSSSWLRGEWQVAFPFVTAIFALQAIGCGGGTPTNAAVEADSGAPDAGETVDAKGDTSATPTGGGDASTPSPSGDEAGAREAAVADATGADSTTSLDAGATDAAADAVSFRDGGVDAGSLSDAGTLFSPCPTDGAACIVMPLGDSITDGFPFEDGGYRVELFQKAVQSQTPITFVGRNTNGPATVDGTPFPRGHEGYSGFTIDDAPGHTGIAPLVDAAISMFRPHIILLHIGTNDVNGNVDLPNAPSRLGALVDQIVGDIPTSLLVVAQIIPTTSDTTNVAIQAYNAAIPGLVQQRAMAGKHVTMLDMYSVFTARANFKTALMDDMLHPNVAGYAAMGDAWYADIRATLGH